VGGILDEYASNQIIIIESANKDTALLQRLLARGNFLISVGGTPSDAARDALDSLFRIEAKLNVEKAGGYKARFSANTGDGDIVLEKTSAYHFSPSRAASFISTEENVALGIAEAIAWATTVLKEEIAAGPASFAKGSIEFSRNSTKTCKNKAGTETGTLTVKTQYIKEADDNPSFDFWTTKHTTQVAPLNGFKNSTITNILAADNQFSYWEMLDYDPTTTVSSSTGSASISFSTILSGSTSWSYSLPDVAVQDNSYGETMSLTHYIASGSAASGATYKVQPGSLIRVSNNATNVWNKVFEGARATFKRRFSYDGVCNMNFN
jgi:hypothetical protein